MPTSRALPRPVILPKRAPSRIMHWRQHPAPPPVPLANRPVQQAGDAPEERDNDYSTAPAPRVIKAHRMIRLFFATLLFIPCLFISLAFMIESNGLSLLIAALASSIIGYADRSHNKCSECRGKVERRAKVCPHCHAKF